MKPMYQVFIAEDEPAALQHLCNIIRIKCQNFQVVGTAENGQEALEQLESFHPDILITDVKMPVMDGFEATRRIRTLSKTIPIIALTAFAFEREKEIAKQCEFTDYVVKPIDIKELKKLIAKVLA